MESELYVEAIVARTELLIYAPPAYGKTTFRKDNLSNDDLADFVDTDDILNGSQDPGSPRDFLGIITNMHSLIEKAELSFAFLPSKEVCRQLYAYRGIEFSDEIYESIVEDVSLATYVFTTGRTIGFYRRFILKAIEHYFSGSPLPASLATPKDITQNVIPQDVFEAAQRTYLNECEGRNMVSPSSEDGTQDQIAAEYTQQLRDVDVGSKLTSIGVLEAFKTPSEKYAVIAEDIVNHHNILMVPSSIHGMQYYGGDHVSVNSVLIRLDNFFKREFKDRRTYQLTSSTILPDEFRYELLNGKYVRANSSSLSKKRRKGGRQTGAGSSRLTNN